MFRPRFVRAARATGRASLPPSFRRAALLALAFVGLGLAEPATAAAGEVRALTIAAQRDQDAPLTAWVRGQMLGGWDSFGSPAVGAQILVASDAAANGWPVDLYAVVDRIDVANNQFHASVTPAQIVIGFADDLTLTYRTCCRPSYLGGANAGPDREMIVKTRVAGYQGDPSAWSYDGPLELVFAHHHLTHKQIFVQRAPVGGDRAHFSLTPLAESGLVEQAPGGFTLFDYTSNSAMLSWDPQEVGSYSVSLRVQTPGDVTYSTIDLALWVVEAAHWETSAWSACSATCGGGVQTRTVVCREGSSGLVVSDAQCEGLVGPKPATEQPCNGTMCPIYGWMTGAWSACSVACGDGVQMRAVVCIDTTTGAIADDTLCTDAMPVESQRCSYPDLFAPVVDCPAPATIECTGDGSAAYAFAASATDGCDGSPLAASCPASGSTFPLGTTTVECEATDPQGNTGTCSSAVTVVDTTPPAIACPAPIVAECTSAAGAFVTPGAATATDACVTPAVSTEPARTFPLGTTALAYSAADAMGYQVTCEASVTVVDTTPPAFEPASLAPQTLVGTCGGPATDFVTPTAIDGCSPAVVACDPSGLGMGANTVTCVATDASGNATIATVAVNVAAPLRLAFQAPLDDDNLADDVATDADVINRFKAGQTVRHKVKLFACDGTDVTETAPVTVRLRVAAGAGGQGANLINDVADYAGVGDAGGLMALVNRTYQFDLATNATDYPRGQQFQSLVTVSYTFAPATIVASEDARLQTK